MKNFLYRELRGMARVVEEKGEGMDFGVTVLERAAMDLVLAIRADLQKEAISGSKVRNWLESK